MIPQQKINTRSLFSVLSKFVVFCSLVFILLPIDAQAQTRTEELFFHAQGTPKPIQDNGGYEGRTIWEINLTGAPSNAVIKSVDIEYWITHPWRGDLKVWLTTKYNGEWIEYVLWDRQGVSLDDIHEKETDLTTWTGLSVNRKWYLCAADFREPEEGTLDSWKIWVYYDSPDAPQMFIPYFYDFTEGKPGFSSGWEYYSTNHGRIEVVDGKLRMDDRQEGSPSSLNEAILHVDLSGQSGVVLTLDHECNNDEDTDTSLPSMFPAHLNGDGIAISADGINWYLVTNLTTSFQNKSFNLDRVVREAGINYTSDFQIKFQQYDNYPWPTDGRTFDNILITATGADPQSREPFGIWKGTLNSTKYGVSGTIRNWILREDFTTQGTFVLFIEQEDTNIEINFSGTYSVNPANDWLSFLYTGTASILTDGQLMVVPCTLDIQGTVFRSLIEGTYALKLSPPDLPPVVDNGTWEVTLAPNIILHIFGIEIATGWYYNDPDVWGDLSYDFSLGLETDNTISYVEFRSPTGYTFQIPSDPYTQVGDIETWHYPIETGSSGTTTTTTTTPSLAAHWTMDDNTANKTVTDSSGNGNHGIARQDTSVMHVDGQIDGALAFNGSSDYIDCGNDSSLDITGSVSISAWVRFDTLADRYQAIVAKRGSFPNDKSNYLLRTGETGIEDELEFCYHDGTDWQVYATSNANLITGKWHHVVVTYTFGTGTSIKCYLNNNLLSGSWTYGNGNVPVLTTTKPVTIGGLTNSQWLNGAIDNLMIFNGTLTESEIGALYSGQQPSLSGSRERWDYIGQFTNLDELDKYGDGNYQITVYYKDGTTDQTTVRYRIPGTNNSIPQPTEMPVLTFPKSSSAATSPLTFTWEPCRDAGATSIGLCLEKQDSSYSEWTDIELPTSATSSDPIFLSRGSWQAQIFFERSYGFNNPDNIDVSIGKYSESDYAFEISESTLAAHWTMDDNAANKTVTDSSGNGNHGTTGQDTSVMHVDGQIDGALAFNGSSDYIDCGNDSSLNIANNISISAWVRFDSLSDRYQTIVAKRGSFPTGFSNYALRTGDTPSPDELEFYYHDGGMNRQVYATSDANLITGKWYHVVVTYTYGIGTSIKCYLNNNLLSGSWTYGNGNVPVPTTTKPVTIGGLTNSQWLNGAIDNLMMFNGVLSEGEIDALYNK